MSRSTDRRVLFWALLSALCILQLAGSAPAPAAESALVRPAEGASVMPHCRFNSRTCKESGYHTGTDFDDNGTGRILAVADGPIAKIIRVEGDDDGLGNLVIQRIDTTQGPRYVLYGHLASISRTDGCLRAGELVGQMGMTGSDNVHLHVEIKTHPGHGDSTGQYYGYTPTPAENWGYEDPEAWFTSGRSTGTCGTPAGGVAMQQGQWWTRFGLTSGVGEIRAEFGAAGDQPRICRFEAGPPALTAFRPSTGIWQVRRSFTSGAPDTSFAFGAPGDRALCGDLLGTGRDVPVVFREATGQWFARLSPSTGSGDLSIAFAGPGDQAMLCDLEGLGRQVPVVYRGSVGRWFARRSWTSGAAELSWAFGSPGDVALCADVFGTGRDTPVVFRPATATFHARAGFSDGPGDYSWAVGYSSDVPMISDVNDDGRLDTVVAR